MKDELGGKIITEFVALGPKHIITQQIMIRMLKKVKGQKYV